MDSSSKKIRKRTKDQDEAETDNQIDAHFHSKPIDKPIKNWMWNGTYDTENLFPFFKFVQNLNEN